MKDINRHSNDKELTEFIEEIIREKIAEVEEILRLDFCFGSIGNKTSCCTGSSGLVGEDDHAEEGGGRDLSRLMASKLSKELFDEKACGCNCHTLVDSCLDERITNLEKEAGTKRRPPTRGREYDCELGRNFITKEECSAMMREEKMKKAKKDSTPRLTAVVGLDKVDGRLNEDTYTLMMRSNLCSLGWFICLFTFSVQFTLVLMIAIDQDVFSKDAAFSFLPIQVDWEVRVGQFFTLMLCLMSQEDVLTSIETMFLLWSDPEWIKAIGEDTTTERSKTKCVWPMRVFLPNFLKLVEGFFVLVASFVIIAGSDNIIDLIKDFTALLVIAQIDDIVFMMADQGYFGENLHIEADKAKDIEITPLTKEGRKWRSGAILIIFFIMLGLWGFCIYLQLTGKLFSRKYPECIQHFEKIQHFENTLTNSSKLLYKHFNDGWCDTDINLAKCGWDGDDCKVEGYPSCYVQKTAWLGDGFCHGGPYNTEECGWDDGDCLVINEKYIGCNVPIPTLLGDGKCDGALYNLPECDYDGGDCRPEGFKNDGQDLFP